MTTATTMKAMAMKNKWWKIDIASMKLQEIVQQIHTHIYIYT